MRPTLFVHGLAATSLGLAVLIAACSGDDNSAPASTDAGGDVSTPEAGQNGAEAAADAPGNDATKDSNGGPEGGGSDAGKMEGGMDGAMDAMMDGPMDAAKDSAMDSAMDAPMMDVATDSPADAPPDGIADAAAPGTLTLSLDTSLDDAADTVKATTFTSVDLLDATGAKRTTGMLSGGDAIISLAGLTSGDYFLRVNGDANDLVPTRVDTPSQNVVQRVGTTLRTSYIGLVSSPLYRIKTYSAGQGLGGIVKFSDGTVIAPAQQPYVLVTLYNPPNIEFRVLGTAALVSSFTPTVDVHPGNMVPFDAWLINTDGLDHHGDMFNADGGAATCGTCHKNMGTKPSSYSSVTWMNAWCFHCHNGTRGSDDGFVDPSK